MRSFEFTCPETETLFLVNSMSESCICEKSKCIKYCIGLEMLPEIRGKDIGVICKLLDECIDINDKQQVTLNYMLKFDCSEIFLIPEALSTSRGVCCHDMRAASPVLMLSSTFSAYQDTAGQDPCPWLYQSCI
jgi:hypothetical protein